MCGFVAYSGHSLNQNELKRACNTLSHRGADDKGIHLDQNRSIGLAHQRLSIIDIESGHQPMTRDGCTVVYNGEIYNYVELKKTLKKMGRSFKTNSDTEVLLLSYLEWGQDCLEKFRGMFSFALWDSREKKLFLARDRLGQKPLYYFVKNGTFLAGSEIQSLLKFPEVSPTLNLQALPSYFGLRYLPSPHTGFDEIKKLEPGHFMVVKNDTVKQKQRYWSPNYTPKLDVNFREAAGRLREKLRQATSLRLRSDVPIAAYLSGGLDSSITVGLVSSLSNNPLKTLTVGFEYDDYSELEEARLVADHFGTNHHSLKVRAEELTSLLPKLMKHFGEPFANGTAIPAYYMSKTASKHVKVVLSGDGSDEFFGGYTWYDKVLKYKKINRFIPFFLSRILRSGIKTLEENIGSYPALRHLRGEIDKYGFDPATRHFYTDAYFNEIELHDLFRDPTTLDRHSPVHYMRTWFERYRDIPSILDRAMAVDQHTYLPENILMMSDITSMMNSVEVRSPFLDHEVIEFACRLPLEFKIQNGNRKRILKEAFKDLLPLSTLNRKKSGLGTPRAEWLRTNLLEYTREHLLESNQLLGELVRIPYIRTLWEQHQNGHQDHSNKLWALLMFQVWTKQFDVSLP